MAKINWKRRAEKAEVRCLTYYEDQKKAEENHKATVDNLNRAEIHIKTIERIETKLREKIMFLERDLRASRQTIGVMSRHIDDLERNDQTNTVSYEKS